MNLDEFINTTFTTVEIRENEKGEQYYWPKNDQHCWNSLNNTVSTPERLAAHVDRKGVCVQAGGNAGLYVLKYAQDFDRVYAFEPDPTNFFCLCANTINYPNVVKFQACVGDDHRLVEIEHNTTDHGGIHIYGEKSHTYRYEQRVVAAKFPIILIDDLSLDACDLIQLDLEGFEYYALLGALETIEKYKPVVCIENFWSDYYYDIKFEQTEKLLTDRGYVQVDSFESDRVYKVK